MIYFSLIVFIGICSFMTLNLNIRDQAKRNRIIILIGCLGIILIQGLRHYTIGIDLPGYLLAFVRAKNVNVFAGETLLNYEKGYILFTHLLSKWGLDPQLYLGVVSAVIILPIGYIWIKKSKMPAMSLVTYICMGFFTFSFSGLRQSIAMAIVFFSFQYIEKKDWKKFILCVILAGLFHKSAFLFLIAYPLYSVKINFKHQIFIIPGLFMIYILKTPIFLVISKFFKENIVIEQTNAYTMLIAMFIFYLISIIFSEWFGSNTSMNAYQNYMLIAVTVQIFAPLYSTAMRAGYPFYLFITLLIPELLMLLKNKATKTLASVFVVLAMLFFYYYSDSSGYLNVVPYHFYWEDFAEDIIL